MIRFIQRHRRLARLLPKGWLARRVWAEALSEPAFVASLEAGLADLEAGRKVPFR